MSTIKDVAALAGVSIATVSHYMNKTKAVSEATAERIGKAIADLDYSKDSMAAWFKTSQVPVIFVATPHADTSFFDDVSAAIEERFDRHDLSVLRVQLATLERMRRGGPLASLLQRAAGVVVLGHSDEWIEDEAALAAQLPTVMLNWDRLVEFREQGLVEHLDLGADRALTYLAERGHRDIGLMTGPSLPRAQGLLAASRKAADRLGLNLDPRWMVETSYDFPDARDRARAMLEKSPRPTAVFTFGTQFGFGVLQAAYQLGINVPGDLSVLSYIDCKQTEQCAPRLTTVSPSIPQIAAHVVARIVTLMTDREATEVTSLEVELTERDSVRSIRDI
ncbi:LacI family DNA-binding transcriptional regulator [Kaistia sp. MMO-174]|uniref:LacI family DNA-binding transcriptional regulator n=1 Tax=Kaistia sp. MMO-174 TaxID=3081256 RepID=UPI00301729CA